MNTGSDRPVAQVGRDPGLLEFGEASRRQALMPGWEFQGGMAIPHWTWVQHENRSATEPAFLFSSTDTPILDAFGIYREELAAAAGR